jgi:hypothetical protein
MQFSGPVAGRVRLGTLDVDLVDEGLGPLRMTALSRAGSLHVSLAAGDPFVRGQLIDHAAELRREIVSAGIDLASFDVGSFSKHKNGSELADPDGRDSHSATTGDSGQRQSKSKAPTQPTSTVSTSRLDLRI